MTHPIPTKALDDRLRDKRTGMKGEPRTCAVCGNVFCPGIRSPRAKYCSRHCVWVATKGPEYNADISTKTAKQRGDTQRGRGNGKGYRKLNGRHEHRVKAETKINRPLRPGEIVHHENEAKQDNDPHNLIVLPNQSEHASLHFQGKKQSHEQIKNRVAARKKTMLARKAAL